MGPGLLYGRQYFLMRYKGDADFQAHLRRIRDGEQLDAIETDYIGLENGLECNFDFDPHSSDYLPEDEKNAQTLKEMVDRQHGHFCDYLHNRVMTIDVWDGESGMHFGTTKVPLRLLMR